MSDVENPNGERFNYHYVDLLQPRVPHDDFNYLIPLANCEDLQQLSRLSNGTPNADTCSLNPETTSNTDSMISSLSLQGPRTTKRIAYRCLLCGTTSTTAGGFRRHVEDQHFPIAEYRCLAPGCDTLKKRRDAIRDHIRLEHSWNPNNNEVEQLKREFSHPSYCSVCPATFTSWKEFHQCFLSHCQTGSDYQQE